MFIVSLNFIKQHRLKDTMQARRLGAEMAFQIIAMLVVSDATDYSLLPNETHGCKKIYMAPKVS